MLASCVRKIRPCNHPRSRARASQHPPCTARSENLNRLKYVLILCEAGPASMDASSQSWLSLPALAAPDSAAAAACPYCAYPSVIRSCCALRGSEPLLWGHDQALDMLRALSLQRHSVHAEYGSLPHLIDTEDGRTLVRSFPAV